MSYDPYPPHDSYRPDDVRSSPDPYTPYDPDTAPYTPYDHARPPTPPRPSAPPTVTYPWQPPPPPPERRRLPRRPALGNHSDLRILRGAYRRQRRVATTAALGYFCLFLGLSAFAPGLMTSTVTGGVPTGLLLALVQLPVTWLAIGLYEHTARQHVDPLADRFRKQAELDARREAAR
ncbi:DUF485 domain-containing protein [Streptomyces sp. NBC_00696]|uniref:DUF485 domain-containing protein n=1 Tax=Streptomyces sp. NBC_00696 TaxID=2903672 RepID=UPI002E340515|nr:DUF485 domain-containing protein [Streptomyces sp. NBC_00696]